MRLVDKLTGLPEPEDRVRQRKELEANQPGPDASVMEKRVWQQRHRALTQPWEDVLARKQSPPRIRFYKDSGVNVMHCYMDSDIWTMKDKVHTWHQMLGHDDSLRFWGY